ncbi:hypothetical protein MMC11_000125 [Xylographa trunciseda]|nr:hypothetical protein [Xylographa trunciseda]
MPFRLEYALSGRAGCKATECKKQGIKIDKGELRHGTFLEIQEHQSWAWKHWGCVTPVQIASLKKDIEGNLDYLDGYEDLNDEDKAKVRQALAEGHVADEDWKYDVEMNRPGKKGFRSPAYKAQQKADKKAAEEQASRATPSKPPPKKRTKRDKRESESEEEADAEPVVKKRRARVKKRSNSQAEAHNVAEASPKKSRSRVKKEKMSEIDHDTDKEVELNKSRAVPIEIKKEEAKSVNGSDLDTLGPKKAKLRAKKPVSKVKNEASTTEDDMPDLELSDDPIRPARTTINGKKSGSKVKPEILDKEGIEDSIRESAEAKEVIEAKGGRKKKTSSTKGPAKTVEPSDAIEATSNTSTRITRSRAK